MFFVYTFMFMRGFSTQIFSFMLVAFIFFSSQIIGWEGSSMYSAGFLIMMLFFVVGLIFFMSLSVIFNNKTPMFSLIPFSLYFFISNNLVMFCLMFEWTIFPLVIIIFWGGSQPERTQGMYYFLLFSVISSYPLVVVLSSQMSSSFLMLPKNGSFLMLSFLFPFLVKLPMFFFHIWLPKAHVEAPTVGSIILAGLMLKFGVWGIFRLSILISCFKEFFEAVFVWGMILGTFSASMQSDGKSLVAYSSVCHMNFLGFMLFSTSFGGELASILIILTHGVSSSMMFWMVGGMYYKTGSRQLTYLSSFLSYSFSSLLMVSVVMFSNFSVPPTLGFWGEVMFLRVFLSFESTFFFLTFIYLILVCYFSVYLMLSLSHVGKMSSSSCTDESFFLGGMLLIFFLPTLKYFF